MKYELSGKQIKEIIQRDRNLSQAELSLKVGVSKSLVSKWLNEKRDIPEEYFPIIYSYIDVDPKLTGQSTNSEDVNKNETYEIIKDDLLDQLERQSKFGKHYEDLVDHAVYLFTLKDELQNDIMTNGIRVKMATGNGFAKEVDNASIRNLNQVSSQLLRVLKDLGLNEPDVDDGAIDDDDYI